MRSGSARGGRKHLDHTHEGRPLRRNESPALRRALRSTRPCCCCMPEGYEREEGRGVSKKKKRERRGNEELNCGSRIKSSQLGTYGEGWHWGWGTGVTKVQPNDRGNDTLPPSSASTVMWCDVMWCDVMWCEVRWGEVRWGEVRWGETRRGAKKIQILWPYCPFT